MGRKFQKKPNIKYTKTRARSATQDESQPSTSNEHSKRRQTVSSSEDSESASDEYIPSTSSSSSKNAGRTEQSQVEISSAEESRLVADCAFYLMVADQKKYAIKKPDIMKNVFKEHKKHYKTVMKKVEVYLKKVAGIRLVELETPKGQYILVNEMKDAESFCEISKFEKMKLGFTMTVLAIIFMYEDAVSEPDMWKALKKIGIDPDTKHPIFGDVKRLLTQDLVKQLYLEYKREAVDPPVFLFSWGPRAKLEVSKIEVLEFVCSIYGPDVTPQQWPTQYSEAMKSGQSTEENQT